MNLLRETISKLKSANKTPDDVIWVGSSDGSYASCWEGFADVADFDYDNDFGVCEVALDLVVVGDNFWLERAEYDGSEWWEYKTLPTSDVPYKDLKKLASVHCQDYECAIKDISENNKEESA